MGKTSAIEWTNATWNPWRGCHKISPGCKNCYMFRMMNRWGNDPNVVVRSKTTYTDPLTWKEPRKIFTCSLSDFFVSEADQWRDGAWLTIKACKQHTFQILTKRPERIKDHLPLDWGDGYANVWLGVSVESWSYLERIDALRKIPAKLRFISFEPLIDSVMWENGMPTELDLDGIGWVIVGGESGPNARPMNLKWAREINDLCTELGIPFFMKQLGGSRPGNTLDELPEDLRFREFPKIDA